MKGIDKKYRIDKNSMARITMPSSKSSKFNLEVNYSFTRDISYSKFELDQYIKKELKSSLIKDFEPYSLFKDKLNILTDLPDSTSGRKKTLVVEIFTNKEISDFNYKKLLPILQELGLHIFYVMEKVDKEYLV